MCLTSKRKVSGVRVALFGLRDTGLLGTDLARSPVRTRPRTRPRPRRRCSTIDFEDEDEYDDEDDFDGKNIIKL